MASLHFVKISLHFPKMQGETGSNPTASATTQFPRSLVTETLREKPALARPIRGVIFAVQSLAGGICRIRGRVSGRKNSVPGAVMPSEESAYRASPSLAYIAGTIRPAHRAGSRCRLHGAGVHRSARLMREEGAYDASPSLAYYGDHSAGASRISGVNRTSH